MEELTIEETVVEIQNGRGDLMPDLWAKVERLTAWAARRVLGKFTGNNEIEFEDLYSTGYIALVDAVRTYQPGMAAFSTHFMYHLKSAFAAAYGYNGYRRQMDPIHNHRSIDAPVTDKDGNQTAVSDLIEDQTATQTMASVEDSIFQKELRQALDSLLEDLPEGCGKVLQLRYYGDMTFQAVADETGVDVAKVVNLERKGIRRLREPSRAKQLRPFVQFDYYSGTGLQAFNHTGLSVQERYLVKQEDREEREQARMERGKQ